MRVFIFLVLSGLLNIVTSETTTDSFVDTTTDDAITSSSKQTGTFTYPRTTYPNTTTGTGKTWSTTYPSSSLSNTTPGTNGTPNNVTTSWPNGNWTNHPNNGTWTTPPNNRTWTTQPYNGTWTTPSYNGSTSGDRNSSSAGGSNSTGNYTTMRPVTTPTTALQPVDCYVCSSNITGDMCKDDKSVFDNTTTCGFDNQTTGHCVVYGDKAGYFERRCGTKADECEDEMDDNCRWWDLADGGRACRCCCKGKRCNNKNKDDYVCAANAASLSVFVAIFSAALIFTS